MLTDQFTRYEAEQIAQTKSIAGFLSSQRSLLSIESRDNCYLHTVLVCTIVQP